MAAMTGNGFIAVIVAIALSLSFANLRTHNPLIAVLSAGMWIAVWWAITQNATLDDTTTNFLAITFIGLSIFSLVWGLANRNDNRRFDRDESSEYQNYMLKVNQQKNPVKSQSKGQPETTEEYRERIQKQFNRGRVGAHRR